MVHYLKYNIKKVENTCKYIRDERLLKIFRDAGTFCGVLLILNA